MAKPDFSKSPPVLVARFDTVAADYPQIQRRMSFGYPCLYVGGNMVTGLHGRGWWQGSGTTWASRRATRSAHVVPVERRVLGRHRRIPQDQVRGLLGDHHDRRVDVAVRDVGHRRRVHDA